MKILMLSTYLPQPTWGAGLRSYYLLKALARHHTVSLLTLADRASIDTSEIQASLESILHSIHVVDLPTTQAKRWQQLFFMVRGQSYLLNVRIIPAMQAMLDTLLTKHKYDAVLFDSVIAAGYHLPAGIKIIINQHNIEYEILQRTYEHEKALLRKWYNGYQARLLKREEIERCKKADLIIVTSERERLLLEATLPTKTITTVPNGVDIETFDVSDIEQVEANKIVFTGTMDYYPNIQAVLFFAQQCWPLIRQKVTDASWQIVGRNPPPEVLALNALPGVTVTGLVPDVRPYLASAAVAIAPLQIGSGTRLKILEALAMRKAVVSTSIGYEGLELKADKHLLVADQPADFAQAVITVLGDPQMRVRIGNAGRELVEAKYSWAQCGSHLLQILAALPMPSIDEMATKAAHTTVVADDAQENNKEEASASDLLLQVGREDK